MRRSGWLAFAVVLGSAAVACQVVAGIERVEKVPATPAPSAPADPCAHAMAPELPTNDDDREKVEPPFYVAFKSMRIVNGSTGLDLDGVCTCFKSTATAFDGGSTCKPRVASTDCDGDGGIDNKFGELFATIGPLVGANADGSLGTSAISEGQRTILIAVVGWNGLPNDRDIDVGLVVSNGIYDPAGCNSPNEGKLRFAPQWCGTDRWTRPKGSTSPQSGTILPSVVAKAWVNQNVLSYRQQISVALTFDSVPLTLTSPIITGRLDRNEKGLRRLTGVMTGRLNASDAVQSLGQFNQGLDPETGEPEDDEALCKREELFPTVRSLICDAVDISSSETFDRSPGDCDAMSMAIEFVAEEATLGEEREDLPVAGACDDVAPELLRCPK